MPILGIWASQISGHLWAPAGAYDALATVTVPSGGVASVSFTDIPTGYKHLQIRTICRDGNAGASAANLALRLNSASSGYTYHFLEGNGTAASAFAGTSASYAYVGYLARNGLTSNVFSTNIIDILDADNTNKYKTIRCLAGYDNNGSGKVGISSSLYQSTAAVSQIDIYTDDAANFNQYSTFSLYGIR